MTGPLAHPIPHNGAHPIALVAKIPLPSDLHVWVVADEASVQMLSRSLRGRNLIVTLDWLEKIWQQGQRRVLTPQEIPVS